PDFGVDNVGAGLQGAFGLNSSYVPAGRTFYGQLSLLSRDAETLVATLVPFTAAGNRTACVAVPTATCYEFPVNIPTMPPVMPGLYYVVFSAGVCATAADCRASFDFGNIGGGPFVEFGPIQVENDGFWMLNYTATPGEVTPVSTAFVAATTRANIINVPNGVKPGRETSIGAFAGLAIGWVLTQ
ncbi:hypothetical protein HK101_003760, partial [Irineochytrium annulatum]